MKRIIAYILTAAAVVAFATAILTADGNAAGDDWTEKLTARQNEVHAAAELLRELGVSEDDPAIKALQSEWWRCKRLKSAKYLGTYTVTGYDPWCSHCQGKWVGVTASGAEPEVGRTVAMCGQFAFGTEIYIDGLGTYTVQDRGVGPGHIDVACETHAECYALTGRYEVWMIGD